MCTWTHQLKHLSRQEATFSHVNCISVLYTLNFGRISPSFQNVTERTSVRCCKISRQELGGKEGKISVFLKKRSGCICAYNKVLWTSFFLHLSEILHTQHHKILTMWDRQGFLLWKCQFVSFYKTTYFAIAVLSCSFSFPGGFLFFSCNRLYLETVWG